MPLYKNREPVRVSANVPSHMRDMLSRCGWQGEDNNSPAFEMKTRETLGVNGD